MNDYCYLVSYVGYKGVEFVTASDNMYFDCEWTPAHLFAFKDHMMKKEGWDSVALTFVMYVGRYSKVKHG